LQDDAQKDAYASYMQECSKPRRRIVQAQKVAQRLWRPAHDGDESLASHQGLLHREFHGLAMLANAVTFQLITPLDNHVTRPDRNLRWLLPYAMPRPRRSCRRVGPPSRVAMSRTPEISGAAAGARDFGTALASCDRWGWQWERYRCLRPYPGSASSRERRSWSG